MSIPTVNQLAQTLLREFGESIDNSAVLAQYESWIQDVYDEIGMQAEWKYLYFIGTLTTTNGVRTFTLDNDLDQYIAMRYADSNEPLRKVRKQELIEKGIDLETTGKPREWYVEKYSTTDEEYTIGLWPIPDTIYDIEVFGMLRAIELTSTTKLPFPRDFLFLIKDGVRVKIREDRKDYSGADRVNKRYKENLQKMMAKNSNQIAEKTRMEIQDIARAGNVFVRLPPEHFH